MNKGGTIAIDALVYDFFAFAVDAVIQERKGTLYPLVNAPAPFSDNAEYNRQQLSPLKRDVNRLVILDLYLFSANRQPVLIERWKINYQRNSESNESKPFPIINRRILTLIRTLHCYLRLIPGYSLVNLCKGKPVLGYQLYEKKNVKEMSDFVGESSSYKFNPVSTSKGMLSLSVSYLRAQSEIVKGLEGGESMVARRPSLNQVSLPKSDKESSPSPNIPIPSQKRPEDLEDPFEAATNTSSYNSEEGLDHLQPMASGEDLRRRSFQMHEGDGLLRHHSGGRQQAKSFDSRHHPDSSPSSGGGHMFDGRPPSSRAQPIAIAGGGRHSGGGYPSSNASSHSTPPFSLLEHKHDTPSSSYPDPTKGSPPYQQFSTSLVSTSPMIAANMMHLLNKHRSKKPSFSDKSGTTPTSAGISAMNWKPSSSPATDTENDVRVFLTLPKSPFKVDEAVLNKMNNDLQSHANAQSNTLDVILYQEKRLLHGWTGSEPMKPPSAAGTALAPAGHLDELDHLQFRASNESNPNDDEEPEEDDDDDVMFAFAIHPRYDPANERDTPDTSVSEKTVGTSALVEDFNSKLRTLKTWGAEFD